jgi:hypothetical protein
MEQDRASPRSDRLVEDDDQGEAWVMDASGK